MIRAALVSATLAALTLTGCGGTGPEAQGPVAAAGSAEPSPDPAATPAAGGSTGPSAVVTLTFSTGGGCYDTADPEGCGEHPYGTVTDDDAAALIAASAQRLADLPLDGNGCGDEFVDGVSRRVRVDVGGTEHVVCLSDAPDDDPAITVLRQLYEEARGA